MKRNIKKLTFFLVLVICGLAIFFIKFTSFAVGESGVYINDTTFPDETFRAYVEKKIDKNGDKFLDMSEINGVTSIDLSQRSYYMAVADYTGLQYFTSLKYFYCNDVNTVPITYLDLSHNINLEYVDCTSRSLSSIDVSKNTALKTLKCSHNPISKLDISNNLNLQTLYCSGTSITELNISKHADLVDLSCSGCPITNLDISNNKVLGSLECQGTAMTSLDARGTNLSYLRCEEGSLKSLNLSGCSNLDTVYCYSNQLSYINVSGCTKLKTLLCDFNNLSTLILDDCPDIDWLECCENNISSINISNNHCLIAAYNDSKTETAEGYYLYRVMDDGIYYGGGYIIADPETTFVCGSVNPDNPNNNNNSGDADLRLIDGMYMYYENGAQNNSFYGFVNYDGGKFIVANGTVAKKNGLVQDPQNKSDWYFCAGGRVITSKTGLVMYNGSTFYVKDGKQDTSVNGYFKYDTGTFFVSKGRVIKTANGLVQDPNNKSDWYFLANGQVQAKKTGLVQYNGAWFYVVNGKLAKDFTGYVNYNGSQFYVVKGNVKPSSSKTTDASETYNGTVKTIADLRKKFPDGRYWNHTVDWSKHSYYDSLDNCNNPDGTTDKPCTFHQGCGYHTPGTCSTREPVNGETDCNWFMGCSQCNGFAVKCAYDLYHENAMTWGNRNDGIKAGDVITYGRSYVNGNVVWGHTVFVIARNGNVIKVAECNVGEHCKISWDREIDLNTIPDREVHSAPYAAK